MARNRRFAPGGVIFHVLNRGNGQMRIFEDESDYAAFERVMMECIEAEGMRLLAYCLMPNHWHMALWPREDGDLGRFMLRLTTMHARRWRLHRQSVGGGHLYQGPYKSFPVECDNYLFVLLRYIERNALRANLVRHAQDWRWCSLWRRIHPAIVVDVPTLAHWPCNPPTNWVERVNRPETSKELEALRRSIQRGTPLGGESWQKRIAKRLGLESTLRPRGRPKKLKA